VLVRDGERRVGALFDHLFGAQRPDGRIDPVAVQAGPFATRAAAVAQLPRVKLAIGGPAFVTTAP